MPIDEGTRLLLEGQVHAMGRVLHGTLPGRVGFYLSVFAVGGGDWQAQAYSTDIPRAELAARLRAMADQLAIDDVRALAGPAHGRL